MSEEIYSTSKSGLENECVRAAATKNDKDKLINREKAARDARGVLIIIIIMDSNRNAEYFAVDDAGY